MKIIINKCFLNLIPYRKLIKQLTTAHQRDIKKKKKAEIN